MGGITLVVVETNYQYKNRTKQGGTQGSTPPVSDNLFS